MFTASSCIFKDRKIPRSLVYSCPHFRREVIGIEVPRGIYTHICGIDLVRDSKTGEFFVLEDNVRTPSGISYVLENRLVMTRTLPDAFQACEVLPVNHYPAELSRILRSLSPRGDDDAQIVLLTPGIYNSAYFEHSFLAQQMGIELVEGRDLIVDGGDRLHEDDPRPEARGRDLPPRGRRISRSAHLPRRFACWASPD